MNTIASVQIHYEPNEWEPEFALLETSSPFVSIRLGPNVSVLSRSPNDLLALAAVLSNAAASLAMAGIEITP